MASPPAIALACRDGGAWRAAVAGLEGLAAACLLAWCWSPFAAPIALAWTAFRWRRARVEAPRLAWDGSGWTLDGDPVRPVIVFDPGVWMLLAFDDAPDSGSSRRRWLALSPAAGHAAWPALRAALYFGAPAPRPAAAASGHGVA